MTRLRRVWLAALLLWHRPRPIGRRVLDRLSGRSRRPRDARSRCGRW